MSCSCEIWPITQGDTLPIYVADARALTTGRPFPFTGWTLTFVMEGPVTRSGPATGDELGKLTYVWAIGDTDVQGDYEPRFVGISPDGKQETFKVDVVIRVGPP